MTTPPATDPQAASPDAAPAHPATTDVLEFLYRLGQAYIACGEQTAQVELILRRAASAYGMRRSRIVAFPTAILISVHDSDREHVTISEGPLQGLRLEQIADVYHLGEAAQKAQITPQEGMERLSAILRAPARFGAVATIVGHIILTVGISLVLYPAPLNMAVAAALGAVVGALKTLKQNRDLVAVPMSVIASATVSILVFFAIRYYGLEVEPIHVLIPPLVTFLPGGMLTLGMIELAYGDMVSGASRLVNGFVQLVLLAFGLGVGAVVAGVPAESAIETVAAWSNAWWAPWLGVLIFGVGVYIHFSAPRNTLQWIALVLVLTFGAQQTAAHFFGHEVSGFFGTLVATPLGYLIQLRFRGPPAMVTFLPAFWILVPGALSLLSVKTMVGDRIAGIEGLVTAVFVFASIALGTLMGATLYKTLTERFGAWRLQVGRAPRPTAKK